MNVLFLECEGLEARHVKRPELCKNIHSVIEDGAFEILSKDVSAKLIDELGGMNGVETLAAKFPAAGHEDDSVTLLDAIVGRHFEECRKTGRALVCCSDPQAEEPVYFCSILPKTRVKSYRDVLLVIRELLSK